MEGRKGAFWGHLVGNGTFFLIPIGVLRRCHSFEVREEGGGLRIQGKAVTRFGIVMRGVVVGGGMEGRREFEGSSGGHAGPSGY